MTYLLIVNYETARDPLRPAAAGFRPRPRDVDGPTGPSYNDRNGIR